jgi:hypothetical protein
LATKWPRPIYARNVRSTNLVDGTGAGWNFQFAVAINYVGEITSYGQIGGVTHGYLLLPVPEPSTLVLAALGGLAMLAWRGRRSRAIS